MTVADAMNDLGHSATDDGADEAAWEEPEEPSDGPGPVFDGDTGQMTLQLRRTFVALLKKRYISSEQNPTEWRVLLQNQPLFESRFNDMFRHLVVDLEYQVAFKKQAVGDGGNFFPTILHDIAYTREQTVLMVHLRAIFRSKRAAGDDAVFVDGQDLLDEIATFRPAAATNHVQNEKAARRAVESLATSGILLESNDADRYRISPIIEVLLPVHRVQELVTWLTSEQGVLPVAAESDRAEPSQDLDQPIEGEDRG